VSFLQPPNSKPEDLVSGPDGALWFLDTGLNAIGRVAPDGTTKRYPLPAPISANAALIVGSDGNLWCGLSHQIARITPSGVITSYAIPTLDADVTDIVSTPDHHIWFVEDTGESGLIGEIA
jgi:virginiamycin B lyase